MPQTAAYAQIERIPLTIPGGGAMILNQKMTFKRGTELPARSVYFGDGCLRVPDTVFVSAPGFRAGNARCARLRRGVRIIAARF